MISVAGLGDARRVVMHGDDAGRIQLQGAPGDLPCEEHRQPGIGRHRQEPSGGRGERENAELRTSNEEMRKQLGDVLQRLKALEAK